MHTQGDTHTRTHMCLLKGSLSLISLEVFCQGQGKFPASPEESQDRQRQYSKWDLRTDIPTKLLVASVYRLL